MLYVFVFEKFSFLCPFVIRPNPLNWIWTFFDIIIGRIALTTVLKSGNKLELSSIIISEKINECEMNTRKMINIIRKQSRAKVTENYRYKFHLK